MPPESHSSSGSRLPLRTRAGCQAGGEGRQFCPGKTLTSQALASRPLPPVSVLPMGRAGDCWEFWRQDGSFPDIMSDADNQVTALDRRACAEVCFRSVRRRFQSRLLMGTLPAGRSSCGCALAGKGEAQRVEADEALGIALVVDDILLECDVIQTVERVR